MQNQILKLLPGSEKIQSYDGSVWGSFTYKGISYMLFDEWNFGADISENSPERYHLSSYTVDVQNEEDHTELGKFGSVESAIATLK